MYRTKLEWRLDASCSKVPEDVEPQTYFDMFYSSNPIVVKEVKKICNDCPVREYCLTDAFTTRDPWGIRGGLTARERRLVLLRARILGLRRDNSDPIAS